jgi:hypothetical protein
MRMGESPDEPGLARVSRRVWLFRFIYRTNFWLTGGAIMGAYVAILLTVEPFILALVGQASSVAQPGATVGMATTVGFLSAVWGLLAVNSRLGPRARPSWEGDLSSQGILAEDMSMADAALSGRTLWTAKLASGAVVVERFDRDDIGWVTFVDAPDGAHIIRFEAAGRLQPDLIRLSDEDLANLGQWFAQSGASRIHMRCHPPGLGLRPA